MKVRSRPSLSYFEQDWDTVSQPGKTVNHILFFPFAIFSSAFKMLSTHAVALSLTLALALVPATRAHYHIADTFIGHDFINGFDWETFDDPTHGRVNYVDQPTALSSNLSFGESPFS